MNVPMNRNQKHALMRTLLVLDDPNVSLSYNKIGDLFKRNTTFLSKLLVLTFVPQNGHNSIYDIMYTMSNLIEPRLRHITRQTTLLVKVVRNKNLAQDFCSLK